MDLPTPAGSPAPAIHQAPTVSAQALAALRLIAAHADNAVFQQRAPEGTSYVLMDASAGRYQATEQRFQEADIEALVAAKYLSVEFVSRAPTRYLLTPLGLRVGRGAP